VINKLRRRIENGVVESLVVSFEDARQLKTKQKKI